MRKVKLLGGALALLCAGSGWAQELPFKAGDRELTFEGALQSYSYSAKAFDSLVVAADEGTQLVVTGTYGYFLDERNELGVTTGVRWLDSDNGSRSDALAGLSYDYHFPRSGSTMVPVVGALARTVMFDAIDDYTWGLNAGVRLLTGADISVNMRAYYERFRSEDDVFGTELVIHEDDIGVRLGFSWLLR